MGAHSFSGGVRGSRVDGGPSQHTILGRALLLGHIVARYRELGSADLFGLVSGKYRFHNPQDRQRP
jgi:hypothetical protein